MLTEFAPAKLNLYLHITGRLSNGYHTLESLAVFLDLKDKLRLIPCQEIPSREISGQDFELNITSPDGWSLDAKGNLVIEAAIRMAELFGRPLDFCLELEKHIPIAAGLGGGSADAAATIRLLAQHWGIDWQQAPVLEPILELAKSLGADVPVCLFSKTALMEGIGDKLSFYKVPDLHLVVMNPNKSVSTKAIFESLGYELGQTQTRRRSAPLSQVLIDSNLMSFLQNMQNDMQDTAQKIEPSIARCLADLAASNDVTLTRMSGSGATCFSLVSSAEAANNMNEVLAAKPTDDWLWSGGLFMPSA